MRWFWRKRERVTVKSRPMTPAEEKAFDEVFVQMRHTFEAMDKFFDTMREKK